MNVTAENFTTLYSEAARLLRRGWLPIVLFCLLSVPGWIGMGGLPTPNFALLLTEPGLFVWQWFIHAVWLALIGVAVAALTLGPATFWLLRIHRDTKQSLPVSDALMGIFIPAILDLLIGMSVTLSVLGFGLVVLAGFVQYAGVMPETVRIMLLLLVFIMFGMIFMMIIGVIYPRLRWVSVASLSGDCSIRERLKFTGKFPKPALRILWRVTALEQVTAFILTVVGGVVAAHFIKLPSFAMNPFDDPVAQLDAITNFMSKNSGPAIALLNGLGWIAIWLFLPLWIVAYEWLPKPASANRFSDGTTNSSTAHTRS